MSGAETHAQDRQTTSTTERITLRMPASTVRQLEALVETGVFPNRSQAIRAFVDDGLSGYDVGQERGSR